MGAAQCERPQQELYIADIGSSDHTDGTFQPENTILTRRDATNRISLSQMMSTFGCVTGQCKHRLLICSERFAKRDSVDFSSWCSWNAVHELYSLRDFVFFELRLTAFDDSVGRQIIARSHDDCHDEGSPQVIFDIGDDGLGHILKPVEDIFDLSRVDVRTAGREHVLATIDNEQEPVVVSPPNVTRA
jgi:hypothetical protein